MPGAMPIICGARITVCQLRWRRPLFSYYHQPPHLQDALVMGVSQSGKSPDIVSVLEEGRRQGTLLEQDTQIERMTQRYR